MSQENTPQNNPPTPEGTVNLGNTPSQTPFIITTTYAPIHVSPFFISNGRGIRWWKWGNEVGDEYETKSYENADGFLTKEQELQLIVDEETLRETLEEETRAEKSGRKE